MNLPKEYVSKMKMLLKDEYEAYEKSLDMPRVCGLRANTLKISPESLRKKLSVRLSPVSWCSTGFSYDEELYRPSKDPLYSAGLFYIQEPSAMCAAELLPIKPGDRVLDMCAAPGGKSTQAAAKLKGDGIIVSNDISSSRCAALVKNIELFGVPNSIISNETPEKLAEKLPGFFTKIIIDAPCSGEGMFRKTPAAIKSWDVGRSESFASLQKEILKNAAVLLSEGGIMSYSTCTFAPEENEAIIQYFLDNNPDFSLLDFDKSSGFVCGRPDWTENGNSELEKCGRLFPHRVNGEGHFIALLKKNGTISDPIYKKIRSADKKRLSDFYDFCDSYLETAPDGIFEIHGTSLFRIPMGLDLGGIRLKRSGLYLGELKKNRFEPSQAFAMTLKPSDVKNITVLRGENIQRYLRGESFLTEGKDGWSLVCIENYPLGWGKIQNGRLKNKYLKGWIQ